jgi:uncharacterized protein YndB with AHSA1/START domain
MTTATGADAITKVYQVFIKTTPEAIWEAITNPDWTEKYGYSGRTEYSPDLRVGATFRNLASPEFQQAGMPEVVVDGTVLEADPPRRLVQTWRFLWSDEIKAEGPTTLTYEISDQGNGICKLTLTHVLENAPLTTAQIVGEIEGAGGGWPYVLSDIKSLLETGKALHV